METKNFNCNGFIFDINYQVGETIAKIFPNRPKDYWNILKIGKRFMTIQEDGSICTRKVALPKENYFPTYVLVDEEYEKWENKYFDGYGTEAWYYAHGGN